MLQQINLYKEKKQKKIILPLRQIIVINLVVITLLFIYSVYTFYEYYKTASELQKLKIRQEKLDKGLVSAQKAVPTEEQKEQLQKKLLEMQQENAYKEKMYATLRQLHYQDSTGLAAYLNAMAEQSMSDLWITKFHLEQNGVIISFEGVTLNSSSVPKYLQMLGKTKVFSGKNFDKLQIYFDEKTKQTKFVIGYSDTGGSK